MTSTLWRLVRYVQGADQRDNALASAANNGDIENNANDATIVVAGPPLLLTPNANDTGRQMMTLETRLLRSKRNWEERHPFAHGSLPYVSSLDSIQVTEANFYEMALFYMLNSYGRTPPHVGANFALLSMYNCRYRQRYVPVVGIGAGIRFITQFRDTEIDDTFSVDRWVALARELSKQTQNMRPSDQTSDAHGDETWRSLQPLERSDFIMYRVLNEYHNNSEPTYGMPMMMSVSLNVAVPADQTQQCISIGRQYQRFVQCQYDKGNIVGSVFLVYAVEFSGITVHGRTCGATVEVLLPMVAPEGDGDYSDQQCDPDLAVEVPSNSPSLGGISFWNLEHSLLHDGPDSSRSRFVSHRWHGGSNIDPLAMNAFAARHARSYDFVPWFLIDNNYVVCDHELLASTGVTVRRPGAVSVRRNAVSIGETTHLIDDIVEIDAESAPVVPWLQFLCALAAAHCGWSEPDCVQHGDLLYVAGDERIPSYDRARAARLRNAFERIDATARAGVHLHGLAHLCTTLRAQSMGPVGNRCYVVRRQSLVALVELLQSERRRTLSMLNVCRLADIAARVTCPVDAVAALSASGNDPIEGMVGGGGGGDVISNARSRRFDVAFNVYGVFLRDTHTFAEATTVEHEQREAVAGFGR